MSNIKSPYRKIAIKKTGNQFLVELSHVEIATFTSQVLREIVTLNYLRIGCLEIIVRRKNEYANKIRMASSGKS